MAVYVGWGDRAASGLVTHITKLKYRFFSVMCDPVNIFHLL